MIALLLLLAPDDLFETNVRPLLADRCYTCHGEKKAKAGLRLDDLDALRRVATSGLLLKAVGWADPELRMPPKEKLPAGAVADIEAWIARGAPLPAPTSAADVEWESRKRWLFAPPADPRPPSGGHPVDAFLRAKLDDVPVAPLADRRTLLRRATYDLIGLPPTPEEMEAFLADASPDAFERVVERLLASPRYGERWGRHWLDLARYAVVREDGAEKRGELSEIREAWRYRDWVVDAFNRDLPYDEFIVHQVAGDLLGTTEGLVASAFLAIGEWGIQNDNPEKMVWDTADEQIDAVGRTFLGLTLACARCHDHKYDPVTTRDYYGLAGIFVSTHVVARAARVNAHTPMRRVALADVDLEGKSEADLKDLLPVVPFAIAAGEGGIPGTPYAGVQNARVRIRGDVARLGDEVPRGIPAVFGASPPITGSGRRELARWLASPDHPLTARVMVNRIWRHHFGRGLVRTPSTFGRLGEAPTHPELLDWLARRFVEGGWSVKAVHRLLMSSEAYRRSSAPAPAALEKDPDNRLLGRMNRRRLEAEAFRDALLAVAGTLDLRAGGPADPDPNSRRRMIYLRVSRTSRSPFEALFDGADATAHTDTRTVSTVAPQALFLLNHPFLREVAEALADRTSGQVSELYARLFGRSPSADEVRDALALAKAVGWTELARALLCANEFVTVD